jgi:hypothetical protein
MRSLVWIAALALAAAGCGKQLNAEFCAQNPHDQDCINAGLTFIDAPTPCSSDEQCAGMAGQTVCDTTKSECVECTPSDQASCAGTSSPHCGPDDRCHECVVDADCVGGICLPQQVPVRGAERGRQLQDADSVHAQDGDRHARCHAPRDLGRGR